MKNGFSCATIGILVAGLAAVSTAAPRTADERPAPVASSSGDHSTALGVRVGTPGIGADLVQGLGERLNLRLNYNGGSYTYKNTLDGVKYSVDLDLGTAGLLLDWHPLGGEFRFTLGGFYNMNELSGKATPTDDTDIGDLTFTPAQIGTLRAKADFHGAAGYAGLGFGNAVRPGSRWTVMFDLGVLFYQDPDFSLSADGPYADNAIFRQELKKEEQKIKDDYISQATWYPVLSLGLAFRF